ncbi:MAG: hypothetical protein NTZ97_03860 [Candidatus Moranbacteria bacterium]|nr:hypothetical protein [Candidatus Moranbacteria bacterium]
MNEFLICNITRLSLTDVNEFKSKDIYFHDFDQEKSFSEGVDNGEICERVLNVIADCIKNRPDSKFIFTPPVDAWVEFLDGYWGRKPIPSQVWYLTPLSRNLRKKVRAHIKSCRKN